MLYETGCEAIIPLIFYFRSVYILHKRVFTVQRYINTSPSALNLITLHTTIFLRTTNFIGQIKFVFFCGISNPYDDLLLLYSP